MMKDEIRMTIEKASPKLFFASRSSQRAAKSGSETRPLGRFRPCRFVIHSSFVLRVSSFRRRVSFDSGTIEP